MTLVRHDCALAAGLELHRAADVEGVRVGRQGDHQWVLLAEEPFTYANPAHLARADAAMNALALPAIHRRFPRPND